MLSFPFLLGAIYLYIVPLGIKANVAQTQDDKQDLSSHGDTGIWATEQRKLNSGLPNGLVMKRSVQ